MYPHSAHTCMKLTALASSSPGRPKLALGTCTRRYDANSPVVSLVPLSRVVIVLLASFPSNKTLSHSFKATGSTFVFFPLGKQLFTNKRSFNAKFGQK